MKTFSHLVVFVAVFVGTQVIFVVNEVHNYLFHYDIDDIVDTDERSTGIPQQQQDETSRLDSDSSIQQKNPIAAFRFSLNETSGGGLNLETFNTSDTDIRQDLSLPKWITSYAAWHNEMRKAYPGSSIFTDPNAPPIIIRYCGLNCGGLHDRLGQFPMDVYIANQTRRVFFYWWEKPLSMEEFLLPNTLFNWTIPTEIQDSLNLKKDHRRLFKHIMHDAHFSISNWSQLVDEGIERARYGRYKDDKILRHAIQAHRNEHILESKLKELGEVDTICSTSTYGNLFRALFKPVPQIENQIQALHQNLNLLKDNYIAVHLRVRHPSGIPETERDDILVSKKQGVLDDKTGNFAGDQREVETGIHSADRQGLLWSGKSKDYAVSLTTRALQCSQTVPNYSHTEPIYLFSDSSDLVHYFTKELPNKLTTNRIDDGNVRRGSPKQSMKDKFLELQTWAATKGMNVISRPNITHEENYHIDLQRGHPVQSYYATFVDLFVASQARCVLYGCGRYGKFAAKLSGNSCELWYQDNVVEDEASIGGHNPEHKCSL